MPYKNGLYIVLEGIDGCGKTTLSKKLQEKFQKIGKEIILTKEPGGSALGKEIRSLLQNQPVPITPTAEFLLFAADRAQHFSEKISPALRDGTIILSDRSGDSSLAYQGYGRGVDKDMIKSINQWAMYDHKPDAIIYVKVPVATAVSRYNNRGKLSAFEKEQEDFFERIAQGFDEMYANADNVITVDGTQSPDELADDVFKKLERLI